MLKILRETKTLSWLHRYVELYNSFQDNDFIADGLKICIGDEGKDVSKQCLQYLLLGEGHEQSESSEENNKTCPKNIFSQALLDTLTADVEFLAR